MDEKNTNETAALRARFEAWRKAFNDKENMDIVEDIEFRYYADFASAEVARALAEERAKPPAEKRDEPPRCKAWCGTDCEEPGTLNFCTNECGIAERPLNPAPTAMASAGPPHVCSCSNDPCPKCGDGPSGEWAEGDEVTCDGCGAQLLVTNVEKCLGRSRFELVEEETEDDEQEEGEDPGARRRHDLMAAEARPSWKCPRCRSEMSGPHANDTTCPVCERPRDAPEVVAPDRRADQPECPVTTTSSNQSTPRSTTTAPARSPRL